ncbi:MAG: glycosyltransferase family 4 protein [Candidatus Peregrinibacteria bacterium]
MKNILLYTDTPQSGGAELQMFLLAKFLDKEKFTPILVCGSSPALDGWCENFEKEGIKVIRISALSKHNPKHYTQLKKIIKTHNIDLLHAHVWNPASCRYAYFAAASMKIPVITTEHDPFRITFIKNLFKIPALKKTAKIITVSKNNQKILQNLYPKFADKIAVIHNGIDTTWWQSQLLRFTKEDLEKIKKDIFGAKPDTLIIAAIAELHERKGLKYLIAAMPEIVKEYPNVKLVIIGEGPDRTNLENLIRKLKISAHVVLLGRRKEIPKLLKSANIFALPSKREAFGMVNLEAMLVPLPVVASCVGGIPEIVENGKTGFLVEPENFGKLAKALKSLIASPDLREKFATAGQKRVLENFSAQKMAEEYEKVYLKILS